MGILDLITRHEQRITINSPSVPLTSAKIVEFLGRDFRSNAGVTVNRDAVLGLPDVLRAITKLSRDVSRIPCRVYRRIDGGKELVPEHPADQLLNIEFGQNLKAQDARQTLTAHAILVGNGYGWIQRENGTPRSIRILDPDNTHLGTGRRSDTGQMETVYISRWQDRPILVREEDMLHVRGLSWDGKEGLNNLERLKEALGISIAGQKVVSVQFRNNNLPNMVITVPYRFKDEEAVDEFRRRFGQIHQGTDNVSRPAIMEAGGEIKPLPINNKDTELLGLREFETRQVANIFSIPIYLLGDTNTTSFASVEQMALAYRDDLDPWLTQWEKEAQLKLLQPSERMNRSHLIEHSRSHLIRTDIATQSKVLVEQVNNGLTSVNEARSVLNLNAIDGGDVYRQPLNIGVMGKTEEPDEDDRGTLPSSNRIVELQRNQLQQEATRMVKRLTGSAKAAARKPEQFLQFIDDVEVKHADVINAALQPTIATMRLILAGSTGDTLEPLVDWLFDTVRTDWLSISGQVQSHQLADAIEELSLNHERQLPQAIVSRIYSGGHSNGNSLLAVN